MESENDRRAEQAQRLLDTSPYDEDPTEGSVVDLLADMMHYCRLNGIDFEDKLRIATNHFTEEVREEEENS